MATGSRSKEESSKIILNASRNVPVDEASSFITGRIEDDTPIFNKQKVEFRPKAAITHMCAANNILILAMAGNNFLRISIDQKQTTEDLEIPKTIGGDKLYNMFLDPSGRHLIISMMSGDVYYVSRNSKQAKALPRLRGHIISAVGWNKQYITDTSSGAILVGTTKGIIFETLLTFGEPQGKLFPVQTSVDSYIKQMIAFDREKPEPIMGIEIESFSSPENKHFILVVLSGRLYQFIGSISSASNDQSVFTSVFRQYETTPASFLEMPTSNLNYSVLRLYYRDHQKLPESFAWMTGGGIYYGKIDVSGAFGQQTVTSATKYIEYPAEEEQISQPLTIILTEYHVLVLYSDRIKVLSVLSEQLVFVDFYPEVKFGKMQGMCRDLVKGTIWVISSDTVYKYKVVKEFRDVWLMYLEKGDYKSAWSFCQYPEQRMKVLATEAEDLFNKTKYEESAKKYAKTDVPFEKIALKFALLDNKEPLKVFLKEKLTDYTEFNKEDAQITMLVMWIVELYLSQLTGLKHRGVEKDKEFLETRNSLHLFLNDQKVKSCCEKQKSLVYELLGSHGDVDDLIYFALLVGDYEKVIDHYLQHEDYRLALEKLAKQNNAEIIYKFSPILMQHLPTNTVDMWIDKKMLLEPKRLIPALVQYSNHKHHNSNNEALRYLEFCVDPKNLNDKNESIHNYLIALYAEFAPDKLIAYLERQTEVYYDQKYALRICSDRNLIAPCVLIYSLMGLYEEAVDLALQLSKDGSTTGDSAVELAKEQARKAEGDEILIKKLWLKIAQFVVETEKENNMKKAMDLLSECDLLKIEDILPFFNDFVTIDDFKDAICNSLADYSKHIEELKNEMNDATKSADQIKLEIQSFKNRHAVVKSDEQCSQCGKSVFTGPFYTFSCMHYFHQQCLINEVLPQLGLQMRQRVEDIQRKLREKQSPVTAGLQKTLLTLKEELDNIIANDCVLCGEIAIRNINKPFIDEKEWLTERKSWL